jgi:hypothetical protein
MALLGAILTGVVAGSLFVTVQAAGAARDLLLSLDGPTQVTQQSPYPSGQILAKDDLEGKYHIWLLTQREATGKVGADGLDHDWTQTELHTLDANLANTPAALYAKVDGVRLMLFIGDLTGTAGDVPGGLCRSECAGFYQSGFFMGGGLIGLNQGYYDHNTPAFDQTIVDHELTHRFHPAIAAILDPAVKTILGGKDYLALPEFTGTRVDSPMCNDKAIMALRSMSGSSLDDPHVNFEEGVAETSEIYISGYRAFMMAYGPELDGEGCGAYIGPLTDELLADTFLQADALYRLWQDQVFAGFGYDSGGLLVPGAVAIPDQLYPSLWPSALPSEQDN